MSQSTGYPAQVISGDLGQGESHQLFFAATTVRENDLTEAVASARSADVVIYVGGLNANL